LEVKLDIAPICLGCFQTFDTELNKFTHTIRCDEYYKLDKTNEQIHNYCLEQSINGKAILVNKELQIDFNYVKKNLYKCRHVDSEYYIQSTLKMNPNIKQIYSDNSIVIFSDCITSEQIAKIIEDHLF
jgi:hypothetical protein